MEILETNDTGWVHADYNGWRTARIIEAANGWHLVITEDGQESGEGRWRGPFPDAEYARVLADALIIGGFRQATVDSAPPFLVALMPRVARSLGEAVTEVTREITQGQVNERLTGYDDSELANQMVEARYLTTEQADTWVANGGHRGLVDEHSTPTTPTRRYRLVGGPMGGKQTDVRPSATTIKVRGYTYRQEGGEFLYQADPT